LAESVGEEPARYEPSVVDYVNLHFLEFTTLGEREQCNERVERVGARLLRTYGGPNVSIVCSDTYFIVVQVHWGSEFAKAWLFAPNIAAALEEMANMNLDIQHYLKFLAEVRRAQVNSTASIDRSRHRRHHVQLGMVTIEDVELLWAQFVLQATTPP